MNGPYDYFKEGDWNVRCMVCGRKRKGSMLIKRWDNLMVCSPSIEKSCWEPRPLGDFVRGIPDNPSVPFTHHPPELDVSTHVGTGRVWDGPYIGKTYLG